MSALPSKNKPLPKSLVQAIPKGEVRDHTLRAQDDLRRYEADLSTRLDLSARLRDEIAENTDTSVVKSLALALEAMGQSLSDAAFMVFQGRRIVEALISGEYEDETP